MIRVSFLFLSFNNFTAVFLNFISIFLPPKKNFFQNKLMYIYIITLFNNIAKSSLCIFGKKIQKKTPF